jgi:hypothetical protein
VQVTASYELLGFCSPIRHKSSRDVSTTTTRQKKKATYEFPRGRSGASPRNFFLRETGEALAFLGDARGRPLGAVLSSYWACLARVLYAPPSHEVAVYLRGREHVRQRTKRATDPLQKHQKRQANPSTTSSIDSVCPCMAEQYDINNGNDNIVPGSQLVTVDTCVLHVEDEDDFFPNGEDCCVS